MPNAGKILFSNNGVTATVGTINETDTVITVVDGSLFKAPASSEHQFVTISEFDGTNAEIVKVTDVTGNVLTVVRAQEGTTGVIHGDGSLVSNNITARTLESFVQTDTDGDPIGSSSINIQPGRGLSNQVASGSFSTVIGWGSKATKSYDVCIGINSITDVIGATVAGYQSEILAGQDAPDWMPSTAYNVGDVAKSPGTEKVMVLTSGGGTSGASMGFIALYQTLLDNNNLLWYCFSDSGANDDGYASLFGPISYLYGREALSAGYDVSTYGSRNLSIGSSIKTYGEENTVIKSTDYSGEFEGFRLVSIGQANPIVRSRHIEYGTYIGDSDYNALSHVNLVAGPDFLPLENRRYDGSSNPLPYMKMQANERTFFSPPVCVGAKFWSANTEYTHGDCVLPTTPNGCSYYAHVFDASKDVAYFSSGFSGASEPSWSTINGSAKNDNDVIWTTVRFDGIQAHVPDYLRFIPSEVGFITDGFSSSVTTQPTISFGVSADKAKWKASTLTTMLTGAYAMQSYKVTNSEGSKGLYADLITAGDGATSGRFFWKGICVETLDI